MIFIKIFWTSNTITVIDFFWCIISNDVKSHVNDWSKKKKKERKRFVFKLRKLIEKKNWFMNRFPYFFMNVHAQIEKLIAKIQSITWNAWMEISLMTSFGAKCGIEDLAVLSVYPSPFGYLGPVSPNWPNAPNTLKQV